MPDYRLSEAADLLGVSDDTMRRWVAAGTLSAHHDDTGRQVDRSGRLTKEKKNEMSTRIRRRDSGILADVRSRCVKARFRRSAWRIIDERRQH